MAKKPGTTVVEYDFNGTTKYSAYTILNNENILVLTADESEVTCRNHYCNEELPLESLLLLCLLQLLSHS